MNLTPYMYVNSTKIRPRLRLCVKSLGEKVLLIDAAINDHRRRERMASIQTYIILSISFLPTFWNCQPVLMKSPTGIDEITNWYLPNCQPVFAKSPTRFLGIQFYQYWLAIWPNSWWFGQYRLVILSIPVGDFKRMWAKRICIIYMHVLSNSSIPVGDFANTGWQFGQFWLVIWPILRKVHFPRFGQVWGRNREF